MKKFIIHIYNFLIYNIRFIKRKFKLFLIILFYFIYNSFFKNRKKFSGLTIIIGKSNISNYNFIEERIKFYFEDYKYVIKDKATFLDVFSNNIKLYVGLKNPIFYINEHFIFYSIDPFQNPHDTTIYHICLNMLNNNVILNKNHIRTQITENKNVYIFGTGDSLENIDHFKFNDGFVIVCNTIVKNKETWKNLNPDILVAADALYHFSDSKFAINFRNDLCERFEENKKCIFLYPAIFDYFVNNKLKKFKDRLYPIDIGDHSDFEELNSTNFKLPKLGNVLNLLVPVGMTFSKKIFLYGFDGRAPDDNDFWKNSAKHFYQEEVEELKNQHPAFFNFYIPKGNEKKYHENLHGDSLEQNFRKAEIKGWVFYSITKSYTHSIQKRFYGKDNF